MKEENKTSYLISSCFIFLFQSIAEVEPHYICANWILMPLVWNLDFFLLHIFIFSSLCKLNFNAISVEFRFFPSYFYFFQSSLKRCLHVQIQMADQILRNEWENRTDSVSFKENANLRPLGWRIIGKENNIPRIDPYAQDIYLDIRPFLLLCPVNPICYVLLLYFPTINTLKTKKIQQGKLCA